MFNEIKGKRKRYVNKDDILNIVSEELIFQEFFGHYPDLRKKYFSPFRQDSHPDCRFEFKRNKLCFVDNAGYKNKVFFDCFQFVMYLYNCDYNQALQLVADRLQIYNIKRRPINILNSVKQPIQKKNYIPIIKFKYKRWRDEHYFTQFDIPSAFLNTQPYFNVSNYWANTKNDFTVRKNTFGKHKHMIAYYFEDTNNVKLYFPNQKYRFHSNCNNRDIFGWHRMGDYLFNNDKRLFITKGGKDELIGHYHYNFNIVGFQQEVFAYLPSKLIRVVKYFDEIFIWFDPDQTGINGSKKLALTLKSFYPMKKVYIINYKEELGDLTDIHQNKKINLIKLVKQNADLCLK